MPALVDLTVQPPHYRSTFLVASFTLRLLIDHALRQQFVTVDDVRILRDIEQYYGTQIVRFYRPHTEPPSDNGVLV